MTTSEQPTVFGSACEQSGGRLKVAGLVGVTRYRIDQVARGEGAPQPAWCVVLERETSGAFTCEQISPGQRWVRIPDESWPWHPEGRPAIEVTPLNQVTDTAGA